MNLTLRKQATILSVLFALLAAWFVGTAPIPAYAAHEAGDAYLKNQSNSAAAYRVCRSLSSSTTCSHGVTHYAPLYPGQTTASRGWVDADGFWVGEGYKASVNNGTPYDGWGSGSSARLVKVAGCLNVGNTTCTKTVYIYRG